MNLPTNADNRPPNGGWAPGEYFAQCFRCKTIFVGDKRAYECADCAYKIPVETQKVDEKTP